MKTVSIATIALALAVVANIVPAVAQVPKLSDDNAWPGHAHAKHGDQCLPASENARVRTFVGEHIEHLLKVLGAHIVERRGFHAFPRDGCARSGSGPCRCAASFAGVAG